MLGTTSLGAIWSSSSPDFGVQGVLDRFAQIAPKVLFAVNGYFYNGKAVDTLGKVMEIAARLPSLELVVWVEYVSTRSRSAGDGGGEGLRELPNNDGSPAKLLPTLAQSG